MEPSVPVIHDGQNLPVWSEVQTYRIIRGERDSTHRLSASNRQRVIVVSGSVRIGVDGGDVGEAGSGHVFDAPADAVVRLTFVESGAAVWISGTWHEPTGGSGVFRPRTSEDPKDRGDHVA